VNHTNPNGYGYYGKGILICGSISVSYSTEPVVAALLVAGLLTILFSLFMCVHLVKVEDMLTIFQSIRYSQALRTSLLWSLCNRDRRIDFSLVLLDYWDWDC